ncbi:hypothetical protein PWT90_00439 [Aphanocladium album]|nr:hypothetical protein PWT90_00439 [Aphanocladium album]
MPSEALSHQRPPAGTAALSSASTAAAAVPHASASLRRRQWATKARTGCLGCPCKSCTKRKTACHYELEPYDDPSPPRSDGRGQWLINTAQGNTASLSVSWDYKGHRLALAMNASEGPWCTGASLMEFTGPVPVWLIPEGWEALEAVHFQSTHQALARTEPYNPLNDIIIAGTLASRLAYIADLEDRDPMPTPATIHLWVRLRQLLSSSLQVISRDITDRDHIIEKKVLQRICDTAGLEVQCTGSAAGSSHASFLLIHALL